jgi:beta-xylosidase
VGMACHDISGRRQPADFEYFEYTEHEGGKG